MRRTSCRATTRPGASWIASSIVTRAAAGREPPSSRETENRSSPGVTGSPIEKQDGRTTSARFEIASITKQFTAAAILELEEQGRLSTEDFIADHLPGVPQHSRKITIHHLLTHTSGIPASNARGSGDDLERAVADYMGDGPKRVPGTNLEYWNGGYALLAGIVERASGRSFMEFCREHLFAPAGMSDTGFTGDEHLDRERAAIGWSASGPPRSALEHPYGVYGWQYRGMGGAVTTVLDLMKWDRALDGTEVLGEKAKARLFRPAVNDYACGWYVGKAAHGGIRHSHGGSVRGFVADLRRYPAEKACIAVLSNTDGMPVYRIAENLECILLGRPLAQAAPPAAVDLAAEELEAYAGVYRNRAGSLLVRVEERGLEVGIEGQKPLDKLVTQVWSGWRPDVEKLVRDAVEIVESISSGDAKPLRKAMAQRIPVTWPENVRDTIWPNHEREHGRLRDVRPLGAVARNGRVEIVLALEHTESSSRVKIAFSEMGLELLDWNGPEFPAVLRLVPIGDDAFEDFQWTESRRLEFVRRRSNIAALSVEDLEFERK